jgi:glycosyltransferase involved in cell wall biosynthesis
MASNGDAVLIIPAYNEQDSIGATVRSAKKHVKDILVIDDGSTDETARRALDAGAEVVPNRSNLGLAMSVRRGYLEAEKRGYEIIIQTDADGQYPSDSIPDLVRPILEGKADIVIGNRLGRIEYDMPPIKKFGNHAFSYLLSLICMMRIHDGQSGFRAMKSEIVRQGILPSFRFSYTQEMIIRTVKSGFRLRYVDIPFYPRDHGESRLFSSPFNFAIRGLSIIGLTTLRCHPVSLLLIPGLLLITIYVVALPDEIMSGFALFLGLTLSMAGIWWSLENSR